ncbi:T9SS type A sorting domain-containing protein [Polaribacter atrinae]|uniref:T9SS type A sorting domain-containing protein n=1 Tax=Polaribacter atrinae TaxID=1333662 RepID=UPI0030F9754F
MKKITLLFLFLCSINAFSQVKLTSSIEEYNNGTTWRNSSKTTYTYDENKNLSSEKYYYWNDSSSSWTYGSNDSFVYNSANKVVSDAYEGFDSSGNATYGYKENYTYNGNNQVVESINLELKDGVYVNEYKNIYTYSGNKITELVDYYWNGFDWILITDDSSKIMVKYGANGLVSEFLYYDWNGSTWSLDGKDVNGYNTNNKLTSSIYYDWNGADYVSSYKEEYSYDANGNLISERDLEYNNGSFEVEYEISYTFDETQMMSSFTHPFKDKFGFESLTGQDDRFVNKVLVYSNVDYRTTYNYGEATASVKDESFMDFTVYPNPTKNTLTIDNRNFTLKNVQIFNVLGKKVFRATTNEINIAHLVNGVYLLKVETENGNVVTKRLIKN